MAQRYKQKGLVDFNQAFLAKVLLLRQLPGTLIWRQLPCICRTALLQACRKAGRRIRAAVRIQASRRSRACRDAFRDGERGKLR